MSKLESHPKVCPCGSEPLASHGLHLLGAVCCERVQGCARRYFGNGRFGDTLEDVVQQCYAKLARPGTLSRFEPPAGRDPADAFRAFVYCVCKRVCLTRLRHLKGTSGIWHQAPEDTIEPGAGLSPLQAFARDCITDTAQRAVGLVEALYASRGQKSLERFQVMLPLILTDSVDYEWLCQRLGDEYGRLKKAKSDLHKEIIKTACRLIQDTLPLTPGLDDCSIEYAVDEEIHDLFASAFPGQTERFLDFFVGLEEGEEAGNAQELSQ